MPGNQKTVHTAARTFNRHQPSVTLVRFLAALAVLVFEIAALAEERASWFAFFICVEAILTILLTLHVRSRSRARPGIHAHPSWIFCLISGSYFLEILVRCLTRTVPTLEILLLTYFRNTVLILSAYADEAAPRRFCAAISTFLIIFSSSLTHQAWVQYLVVLYAMGGACWLMNSYWENLRFEVAGVAQTRRFPRRWLLGIPALLILLALVPAAGIQTRVVHGFMPSSGGTDWYSEAARQGVGNGDSLVAGTENIQSFAAIEDAPFMSSHEPSLYDMFDDTYDEPVRPQNQDRAIGLAPQLASLVKEREVAESKQAGKQFSTLRKSDDARPTSVDNRDSRALLHIKGRVPLHLKLESYDVFDGINWFPEPLPADASPLSIEALSGRPWLRLPIQGSLDLYASPEIHAVKVIGIDTNRVPTPNQLIGIHIDQVDRLDLYTWAQPGLVRMDREKLPSLTVIQLQSRVPDPNRLREMPFSFDLLTGHLYRQQTGGMTSHRIRELASSITSGLTRGWPQIEAITRYVRSTCDYRPESRPPENCENSVEHFLFESREGPDYQFASATVMLLRSLGYPARLVSGLYADPRHYEARSGHTSVFPEDVHFWVEVRMGRGDWLTVDPTPGYEVLQPVPGFIDQLKSMFLAALGFLRQRILLITGLFLVTGLAWWMRILIADGIATLVWRLKRTMPPREYVRWTVWLLARRCEWIGQPRPASLTATRWISTLTGQEDSGSTSSAGPFLQLVDWASYAPAGTPPPQSFVHQQCARAVSTWTRDNLRGIASRYRADPIRHRNKQRAESNQRNLT